MPPLHLVLNVGWHGVILPLIVAGGVSYGCVRFLGRPGQAVGGLLALILSFLVGNFFLEAVQFRLDFERPLSVVELSRTAVRTVTGIVPASQSSRDAKDSDSQAAAGQSLPPSRYWLPWVGLLGGLMGLLVRIPKLPVAGAWVLRIVTVIVISRLLVGPVDRTEMVWLWPVLAAVLLANWSILEMLGGDPTSNWLTPGMIWISMAAATVLIHAHIARFTDLFTILMGCWIGLAIVERIRPGSLVRTSALPVMAIALPGIMLNAQQTAYSEVPTMSYVLMGVMPIGLVSLLFLPRWRKSTKPYLVGAWALMLVPTLLAVALAISKESLSFE